MLFTAADILTLEPVKILEQQLTVNSFIIDSVRKITGIQLDQKNIRIKNQTQITINTTGARKMIIVLHRDQIEKDLKLNGFSLKV